MIQNLAMDFGDYQALQALYADNASALDAGQFDRWIDCFTVDATYRIQPRENYERGFPLATLALEGHGMMRDRVYGITRTIFHDPYYQRHVVGTALVRQVDEVGRWHCEANYAVFRTKLDGASTVFNVGRYLDVVQRTDVGLKFAQRLCVYDSEMIPNSLIYPI